MEVQVKDGVGDGNVTKVDDSNRLWTRAVTETNQQEATGRGDSYNINTGFVTLSAATAMLYFKNDEDNPFVIDAIAVGLKTASTNDTPFVTVVRNPTAGTLVSGATAVDMNQNRNFGSNRDLSTTTLAYKGTSGSTLTNGNDIAIFSMSAGSRLFASVDFELPKGSSIGIEVDPDLASGTVDCYVAIIGYVKD